MMLVGVPGCGKHALTVLAAHLATARMFEDSTLDQQGHYEVMDYLRNMMQDVGTSNRLGVFYVFSAHSVDSHFIEHVNTILAHGVTLGVFTTEDEHTIHTQLSEASEGKGLQRTTQED